MLVKLAALRVVNPLPLPLNVPLKVRLAEPLVTTIAGNCASGIVPLEKLTAFRLVRPLPLPAYTELVMYALVMLMPATTLVVIVAVAAVVADDALPANVPVKP